MSSRRMPFEWSRKAEAEIRRLEGLSDTSVPQGGNRDGGRAREVRVFQQGDHLHSDDGTYRHDPKEGYV